jgi:transposase-like protein
MTMTAEKFRELAALRKVPGANIGARYSTAERRWAVAYARQPGMSANRTARALGISDVTMRI